MDTGTSNSNARGLFEIQPSLEEVVSDFEESKYQNAELPLSYNGKSPNDDIFKTNQLMSSFQQILKNIFKLLFEATNNPSQHPKLHKFLQHVIGFNSVDDEFKPANPLFDRDAKGEAGPVQHLVCDYLMAINE
ncbi:AMP deaminase 2-like [Ochlerotatus camptorhynchus]|uniref:AMP deaminase 2-like n=1 Tax=Ochlerotatus camptorhynchus TaxID=644619 RepID=UPI0031D69A18